MSPNTGGKVDYPTTRWSLIAAAGQGDGDAAQRALSELLLAYMPALRAYLILSKGVDEDAAEELVQQFVVDRIIIGDLLAKASRTRGRFRWFVARSLSNYVISRWRASSVEKRHVADALGSSRNRPGVPHDDLLSQFSRQWGRAVIEQAVAATRRRLSESGRTDMWDALRLRTIAPCLEGTTPVAYQELVDAQGLESPAQVQRLLYRAKQAFAESLREVIREYARDEGEVELELAELKQILSD